MDSTVTVQWQQHGIEQKVANSTCTVWGPGRLRNELQGW